MLVGDRFIQKNLRPSYLKPIKVDTFNKKEKAFKEIRDASKKFLGKKGINLLTPSDFIDFKLN